MKKMTEEFVGAGEEAKETEKRTNEGDGLTEVTKVTEVTEVTMAVAGGWTEVSVNLKVESVAWRDVLNNKPYILFLIIEIYIYIYI